MIRPKWWLPALLLAGLLVAAGCAAPADPGDGSPAPSEQPAGDGAGDGDDGAAETPPGSAGGDQQPDPARIGMDRPERAEAIILIEGMGEPVPIRLFSTPADWPLQFSTYHPEDWVAEAVTGDGGAVVRFTVAYGGHRNDDAYLEVVVYPAGTDEASARRRAADQAADLGIAELAGGDRWYPWSLAEYGGVAEAAQGLALGRHGDGWFHVRWHYPPEHGDGFGPRQALVLDEWIWADSGLPLDPGK